MNDHMKGGLLVGLLLGGFAGAIFHAWLDSRHPPRFIGYNCELNDKPLVGRHPDDLHGCESIVVADVIPGLQ